MEAAPEQLSLGVSLREDTTFANFWPTPENQLVAAALQTMAEGRGDQAIALWGPAGSGRTHLLQAVCHRAATREMSALYLPLRELTSFEPAQVLEGMEALDILCVDDLQAVIGVRTWEQQLFHLYNRCKDAGRYLLLASQGHPAHLPWQLPDLKSRVLGSVLFQVVPLADEQLAECLQSRATARGMALSDEVANFILHRVERNASHVFELLDRLDAASLQQQRKLTVPFVKSVLQV